jgi:hypothetical protein
LNPTVTVILLRTEGERKREEKRDGDLDGDGGREGGRESALARETDAEGGGHSIKSKKLFRFNKIEKTFHVSICSAANMIY